VICVGGSCGKGPDINENKTLKKSTVEFSNVHRLAFERIEARG
jgi:hypothetical protein